MPATVVGREVKVVQVGGKVFFAPAPIDAQILDQKAGHYHAQAVVHVAGLVQLPHGRVHQRVAGARFAPGLEQFVGVRAVLPGDGVVVGLEALAMAHMGKVVQHLHIKVTPDQFGQPNTGPHAARQHARVCLAGKLANRHGAKAQMHAQIAGPLDGREVARVFVCIDTRQKVVQQGLGTRLAGRDFQDFEVGGLKPDVLQAGHRFGQIVGARRQALGQWGHVKSLQVFRGDFFQPGVFVRGKDAEGLGHLGQHFVALKDHMVLEGVQHDAVVSQMAAYLNVARQRLGLVVVVGKHRLGLQVLGQFDDFVLGHPVSHDQARLGVSSQFAQLGIDFDQRFPDEFHPAVGAGQGVQYCGVKHKHHMHALAMLQGLVQGRMVGHAQVASQPDQTTRKRGFHQGLPGWINQGTFSPSRRGQTAKIGA